MAARASFFKRHAGFAFASECPADFGTARRSSMWLHQLHRLVNRFWYLDSAASWPPSRELSEKVMPQQHLVHKDPEPQFQSSTQTFHCTGCQLGKLWRTIVLAMVSYENQRTQLAPQSMPQLGPTRIPKKSWKMGGGPSASSGYQASRKIFMSSRVFISPDNCHAAMRLPGEPATLDGCGSGV
ncbi:unnamed protein product [Cladocopium goreaui]|uniref:Uncharacterized protein n=1 Tax=Cladocopium goreaui TaxID=2562237 RepID=A0A9P1FZ68_9DINO|nr:unnamed protein product [Cladocopium goreaui]